MMDGEAIGSDGTRVAAFLDGPGDEIGGEMRVMMVEGVGANEVMFDDAIDAVCSMWGGRGELFIEGGSYFFVIGELSVDECYGLVGSLRGFLPREGSEKGPEI